MMPDYSHLAHESFAAFVKTVAANVEKHHYDLILAGVTLAIIAAWIANQVFSTLQGEAPPTSVIPVYRHSDEAETILFDNRIWRDKSFCPIV